MAGPGGDGGGHHTDLVYTVSRVQIRLLRPPWFEDLMQLQESPPPSSSAAAAAASQPLMPSSSSSSVAVGRDRESSGDCLLAVSSGRMTAEPSPPDSSDDELKMDFVEGISNNNSNTSTPGPTSRSASKLQFPLHPSMEGTFSQTTQMSVASSSNGKLFCHELWSVSAVRIDPLSPRNMEEFIFCFGLTAVFVSIE